MAIYTHAQPANTLAAVYVYAGPN